MDPNHPFNTQNSSTYPFSYPNPNFPDPNNYQFPNQSANQTQNIPNYGYPPNFFMPPVFPNYHPHFGSMMSSSSQAPPYSSTPTGTQTGPNAGATEFPEFSTQMTLGGMSDVQEVNHDANESTPARQRNSKWTTEENLVLMSGWLKFGTNSIVGKNQKGESFWSKIAKYCNEHCSFDPPRDGNSCRNHFNYVNRSLGKWVAAYDSAKRLQQSGWSENDVLAKADEFFSNGGSGDFKYMQEWLEIRDQPRYRSLVGENTGSGSSGSKRAHQSEASDSNSVGSNARPMGRDATKKKAKKKGRDASLEELNKDWSEFEQRKAQHIEKLEELSRKQDERVAETNRVTQEKTQAKKMKMWLKLNEKEHLDEQSKELFKKLGEDLFGK